ncbi:MAG: antitoxin [Archaeoglobales archaeon]|nr:MAG: antitoxin [Archaeoglobales archaeon]
MSVVIGVRVPERLKKEMEELGIDYTKEIREYLEKRVKEEKLSRILKRLGEMQKSMKKIDEDIASKIIREERELR